MDVLNLSHARNRMNVGHDLEDELLASHKESYPDAGKPGRAYMQHGAYMVYGDCMELDGHMLLREHMLLDEHRESCEYIQLPLSRLNAKAYFPATQLAL